MQQAGLCFLLNSPPGQLGQSRPNRARQLGGRRAVPIHLRPACAKRTAQLQLAKRGSAAGAGAAEMGGKNAIARNCVACDAADCPPMRVCREYGPMWEIGTCTSAETY